MDRPLRWHRHWVRFVGRDVSVKLEGLGRVRARIVAVPDEATVVLQPEGREPVMVPIAAAREARLAVDWQADSR
jgi:ribosome maturation factor RimP